jgi:hypothetical protein
MSTAMTWAGTVSPRRLASDDAPMIPRLLRTLLPITFPTTTSAWRFTAATKVVRNSCAEVLSAMTVGPITGFEIPNRSPVPTALARHTSRAGRYVSRPSENMLTRDTARARIRAWSEGLYLQIPGEGEREATD